MNPQVCVKNVNRLLGTKYAVDLNLKRYGFPQIHFTTYGLHKDHPLA